MKETYAVGPVDSRSVQDAPEGLANSSMSIRSSTFLNRTFFGRTYLVLRNAVGFTRRNTPRVGRTSDTTWPQHGRGMPDDFARADIFHLGAHVVAAAIF